MSSEFKYLQNPNFPNRYISPEKLFFYLEHNLRDSISQVGSSTLGKPIYKVTFGSGPIKVLAWSQMHGNESNSTHAMLIFMNLSFLKNLYLKSCSVKFNWILFLCSIRMESEKWTRRNAMDIDMNRDFNQLASKELKILRTIAEKGDYHYGLNLHEQRTLFSTDGIHPATLSFLAPAESEDRQVTETRKKEMAVIARIANAMRAFIPNQLARYNDEFYPNSTGDNFTKMGLPTILYEGGHFPEDYRRMGTRKYYTIALYEGLKAISELNGTTTDWEDYFLLPENKEDHFDIIYRNVSLNTNFPCVVDIAIQYKEQIIEGYDEITFLPMVVEVGDCGKKKGWKEVDCTGKKFVSESLYPKLDEQQNFTIE